MNAVVIKMIANLYAEPNHASELIDEVLYGMTVQIVENLENNWVRVQTSYRYEGYCQRDQLLIDNGKSNTWLQKTAHVVNQNFADILCSPRIQSSKIITLVKGSLLCCIPDDELDPEWVTVQLATGEVGYTRRKWLDVRVAENSLTEEVFRDNVVHTAFSYLTTPYRWGGKTPLGIDCSGLCSMAYMLNGVSIYRDANIVEGFPIKEIPLEKILRGDLLYFPGHIALYIGDGLYIHSSLDSNEVNINSLDEEHPHYRKDLATTISAVGSLFPLE